MQEENKTPEIKKNTTSNNAGLKQIQKPPQKKKKKMSAGALGCIVLVVLFAGALAAVYFDLGGTKQIAASLLKIEPVRTEADEQIKAKQDELDELMKTLDKKESDLDLREDELSTREDGLSAKEGELTQREAAVVKEETEADAQREAYLKTVAERFGKMDVKKAASAIAGMETAEDMAKLLLYIPTEQAALVMNQMKSALVTEILSEMMK